jgi:glutathione-regulated potassium-efflux system protein KefB
MVAEASGNDPVQVVALLAAGVVAVPIFKRLGLGSGSRHSTELRE